MIGRRHLARLAPVAVGLGPWFALSIALGVAVVAAAVGLMGAAGWLITSAALLPPLAELQLAIVGVRFFGLARAVARYADRLVGHRLALELLERIRAWLLGRLEPLAPARITELRSADLLARIIGDVESLEQVTVRGLAPPVVAALTCLGVGVLVGAVDRLLGVAAATGLLTAAVGVPVATFAASHGASRRAAAASSELRAAVVDTIAALPELLAWRRAADRIERIGRVARRRSTDEVRLARVAAAGSGAISFLSHATVWTVILLGVHSNGHGRVDGVGLAVAAFVVLAGFEALEPLPAAAASAEAQATAVRRIVEVLDHPPAVTDPITPVVVSPRPPSAGPLSIELRDVSFRHPDAVAQALSGVTLQATAGSLTAVIGPSGAGKSTLVRLLSRTWDPDHGTIEIDGVDLRQWRLEALRRTVVTLGQATRLFAGTVRDNLRLAAPSADDDQLVAACRAAAFQDDLEAMPEGLDTWIGDHGVAVSGGQARRLEIARTWLADPAVLVLDEPTAHLDPATEGRVLEALGELLVDRTAVVVTHRLRVAATADRIAVLVRGRITAIGDHSELLGGDPRYRRWWHLERSALDG